jgi:hypothetical protein
VEVLDFGNAELTFEVDKTPDPEDDIWALHINVDEK